MTQLSLFDYMPECDPNYTEKRKLSDMSYGIIINIGTLVSNYQKRFIEAYKENRFDVDFLKKEYGMGGCTLIMPEYGIDWGHIMWDGKGIKISGAGEEITVVWGVVLKYWKRWLNENYHSE